MLDDLTGSISYEQKKRKAKEKTLCSGVLEFKLP